jgi:hypothetical protein
MTRFRCGSMSVALADRLPVLEFVPSTKGYRDVPRRAGKDRA